MARNGRIRRLVTLAPWTALLLAIGCGDGSKSPAGPEGDGTATYDLVALGRMGLPADVQVEDCITSRFQRGELQLDENGAWEMWIEFSDANYELATASDDGRFVAEGATVWLASEWSGITHQATLDGGEVRIQYDWCFNGVADVQLVFAR